MIDFVDKNDLMALTGYSQTQCKKLIREAKWYNLQCTSKCWST